MGTKLSFPNFSYGEKQFCLPICQRGAMAQWPPKYATEVNWYLCVSAKPVNLPDISLKTNARIVGGWYLGGGTRGLLPLLPTDSHFSIVPSSKWSNPPPSTPPIKWCRGKPDRATRAHTHTRTHPILFGKIRSRWRHGERRNQVKISEGVNWGRNPNRGREALENWGRSPNRGREAPENWGRSPNRGRSPR